jgi:hypothetical protein
MTHHYRIDIPSAKPADPALAAADIIIAAIRDAGICPHKAAENRMLREMSQRWVRGELGWSRADFVRACRNVLVLNPGLAP